MGSQTVQSPSIFIGISFSKIGSVESGYSCILFSEAGKQKNFKYRECHHPLQQGENQYVVARLEDQEEDHQKL
ncbi:hypothetical protein OUZ56_026479 [Daphnia magna]|uniref:Uncharacterized protein n=1 Tax=Daphnia magna TaxID=35525 RepID=A0ABQ9ZLV6_9CRUS|nr:hypothetical protein OUZ56_026479 [Daphnia magna]